MLAYGSLFFSGLLAATLFPASSEVLLLTLLHQGYLAVLLWLVATSGNTAGSCINWYLGWRIQHFQHKKWFPVSQNQLQKAQARFQRYGHWSLLFSWLPIIGDPLTLIAGLSKVRFGWFLLLVASGKGARYAVLIVLALQWQGA